MSSENEGVSVEDLEAHIASVSRPDLMRTAERVTTLQAQHALAHLVGQHEGEVHDNLVEALVSAQHDLRMGLSSIWN